MKICINKYATKTVRIRVWLKEKQAFSKVSYILVPCTCMPSHFSCVWLCGVLQFMGLQLAGDDLATEQQAFQKKVITKDFTDC